ncbi:SDR family oxidoreductase [Leucobacter luti]|uniref:NAD(P)-dependent dehydrogenase (Short-subunit alcohol dehydrogenase family) n=1 Tax=Leucobacter luti TaxID=340320 RepID=A0A4Q7TZQ6_9MICO|nr:SDR family oxidoreductase [Leucobacter luti]MBL3698732.1 SDR family oxidoreductase [Leucobacter luti]RZT66107.1 NAD(P)-dependent dehydrogenase (short-subunit alcohol dehydrogenase family) [Leucobacter luti]
MSRTYVVTGAASGIGKTTTQILRDAGNTVIGVDLKGVEVSGDLSSREGRLAAAAAATELAGGTVDAVIACAGLSIPKPITASVNYFGMTEFLDAMQPALARAAAPRVALISSVASLQPTAPPLVDALLSDDEAAATALAEQLAADPQTANLIYSSSKQAISRWVRREAPSARWAGAGIPVNAVGPGTVVTPMTKDLLASEEGRKLVDTAVPMPLNSHQGPESIANLLIWLTSEQNTHCCGQTIYCDGGADAVLRGEDVWSWNETGIRETFAELMGA